MITKTVRLRTLGLGTLTLVLVLAAAFAVSPAVRAQVQDWIGPIGGVLFTETGNYPGGDEPVIVVEEETASLEEARARLPFPVDLPTWVPEGYALEEVRLPHFPDEVARVYLHWEAAGKASLELEIVDQPPAEASWIVGPGSAEETLINGQPAALVRGGWNADTQQWDGEKILSLYWQHGEQTYVLRAFERDISVDELMQIAESIP